MRDKLDSELSAKAKALRARHTDILQVTSRLRSMVRSAKRGSIDPRLITVRDYLSWFSQCHGLDISDGFLSCHGVRVLTGEGPIEMLEGWVAAAEAEAVRIRDVVVESERARMDLWWEDVRHLGGKTYYVNTRTGEKLGRPDLYPDRPVVSPMPDLESPPYTSV